jgi:molybdenum cofactor cytidylyltransferase
MTKSTASLSAVILSAGFSSRMGRVKPLLDLGGMTVVERVVDLYRNAGVADIHVVVGYRGDEIQEALKTYDVHIAVNHGFEEGMYRTIQAGVEHLPTGTKAFFIHPVDIPLIRVPTIKALLRACQEKPAKIFCPCFNGLRGHPPLIAGEFSREILSAAPEGGLRTLLENWKSLTMEVPVADEGILLDLDTPEDYRRLQARLAQNGLPSYGECRALMETVAGLPEAIIAHSWKVGLVARALTGAINSSGGGLDEALILGAAFLHDVAWKKVPHDREGARMIEEWGFPRLAPIVRVHLNIEIRENEPINEAEVVYLADKVVSGDRVIDLEQRFQEKMKRYVSDSRMAAAVKRRLDDARCIRAKVERMTGRSLQSLLEEEPVWEERLF